jgi:hypothetical protein
MARLYQRRIYIAPFAGLEPIERVWADGHAHQPQCRETHGRGHAPHLAVAALGDD